MTVHPRRVIGAAGGVVVVVLLLVVLLGRTGGDGGERLAVRGVAENAPSTTPTARAVDTGPGTTLPLVPVTTGVPVPNAFEPPPSTAPPSATPAAPRPTTAGSAGAADGSLVTAEGAALARSPSGAVRRVDKSRGCTSATAEGWKVQDCGALRTSGTVLLWLVETKGKGMRALVLKEQTSGVWSVVLSAADVDGTAFSKIGVRGEDVSGDGQPELVFGFHRRDAASTLAMDVVDAAPAVVAHRDLPKGVVQLAKGEITTWAAAAEGYDRVAIRFAGGAWRASAPQRVERGAVPASMI